jgi:hypothetical protein
MAFIFAKPSISPERPVSSSITRSAGATPPSSLSTLAKACASVTA